MSDQDFASVQDEQEDQDDQQLPLAFPFQLTPGDGTHLINYRTKEGISLYTTGSRSLYEDPADLFNVEASGLNTFLSLLQHRANSFGWDFDVPTDLNDNTNNLLNLVAHHGRFTMEHLHDWSNTYLFAQNRAAQDNVIIVKCIIASLSLPGFRKVQVWHDTWHIRSRPVYPLLIKVIIREAYIDTQATTRILREHLSSLPTKLEELKGDIDQLNAFVKVTQDQLLARNETTHDLLSNLFKGYLSSRDVTFRRYIEKKQEDYDDGTAFTVDGLMNLASNKYKTLVQAGKWMAPTDEQAKIIALETKLGQWTKKSSGSNKSSNQPNNSAKSSKDNSSKKGKKGKFPAWQTKYPGKDFINANKTKVVEGRTYWWCKKHKRFVMHQTHECKKGSNQSSGSQTTNNSQNQQTSSQSTPSIRISTATIMDE